MGETYVREWDSRSSRVRTPVFDPFAAKRSRPRVRPGTIRLPLLIERLAREDSGPIVPVVAPAGYGKTTLLPQWADHSGQAFAWVLVDEGDNNPKVLLTYVAEGRTMSRADRAR